MDLESKTIPNKKKSRKTYSADLKLQIITRAESIGIKEAAKKFGVGQSSICKWSNKYRQDGVEGLVSKSTRPHYSPKKNQSMDY